MQSVVHVMTSLSLTYQIVNNFFSINRYNSDLIPINCSVPQGSVLGLLLFLIYINDLRKAIQYCKVQHFADDTNLFHTNKSSVENLNRLVNNNLKQLNN